MSDIIYYAIGDVHGEADRLARLHDLIIDDQERLGGDACIVHLGDLIDRGPDSRGVINRAIALEFARVPGIASVTIRGNHEQLMMESRRNWDSTAVAHWLHSGGKETVDSYERVHGPKNDWRDAIDDVHWYWLNGLPTMHFDESRRIAFVHGGIDPAKFPRCDDETRIWTRSARFNDRARWPAREELNNLLVVHGHTPTQDFKPFSAAHRINVDTGAVFGGPLTCVALAPGEGPRFLFA